MKKLLPVLLLSLISTAAGATEPEVAILRAGWALDAPVAGDHAVALIEKITSQVDQTDFTQGEWRRFKIGLSDTTATLTLMHRYDGAESDFPVPAAGAEEWSLQLTNTSYAATIEWTTSPEDATRIERIYTHDQRLRLLPRFATDPRVAVNAALQHARLDALHPNSSLVGVLRDGHAVWEPRALDVETDKTRLPMLLIVASGYNTFRSKLARDATMGPACVGWQSCNEQRGVAASK